MSDTLVVLVGPMGSGKSSIGRKLAKLRGWTFSDTDKQVEASEGESIAQIFVTRGEPVFRDLERDAAAVAVASGGVVALGGGAVLNDDTRRLLKDVPVVYLTISAEAVAERINTSKRPLLHSDDPITTWQKIAGEREGLYREVANLTLDTSRRPLSHVAKEISAWLDTRNTQQEHS